MAKYTLSREVFDALAEEFADVRDDYSGRGMYGAECFALVGNLSTLDAFREYVHELTDDDEDVDLSAFDRSPVTDSMGLDTVYYWPNVAVAPATADVD